MNRKLIRAALLCTAALLMIAAPAALALFGQTAPAPRATLQVEGKAIALAEGLTLEFLDELPAELARGSTTVAFRISSSRAAETKLEGVRAVIDSDPTGKLSAAAATSSLTVPAGGAVDSSVTITTSEEYFAGETASISIECTIGKAIDFVPVITLSSSSGEGKFGVTANCLSSIPGDDSDVFLDSSAEWRCDTAATCTLRHGALAGFVFDQPGNHVLELDMLSRDGRRGHAEISVTANDFPGTTYYVDGLAGSDTANGLTPETAWRTYAQARTQRQSTANARILFKSGTTYTAAATWTCASGVQLGSYGGGRATIRWSSATMNGISVGSANRVTIDNLRLEGPNIETWTPTLASTSGAGIYPAILAQGSYDNLTIVDVVADGWNGGLLFGSPSSTQGEAVIHNSELRHATTGTFGFDARATNNDSTDLYNVRIDGLSSGGGGGAEHQLRIMCAHRFSFEHGFVGNNRNSAKHNLKLHAQGNTGTAITDTVSFVDVEFGGPDNAAIPVNVLQQGAGPTQLPELVRRVIFQACRWTAGSGNAEGPYHLRMSGQDFVVRDCTFRGLRNAIQLDHYAGSGFAAKNLRVYGSSWYTMSASAGAFVREDAGRGSEWSGPVEIRNCAVATPAAGSTARLVINTANFAQYLTTSNNVSKLAGANVIADPLFVSPTDLHLMAGSPCIGAGIVIGQHTRWDGEFRERGDVVDAGAFKK